MHAGDIVAVPVLVMGVLSLGFSDAIAKSLTMLSRTVFQEPIRRWPWVKPLVLLVFENTKLPLIVKVVGGVYVISGLLMAAFFRLLDR